MHYSWTMLFLTVPLAAGREGDSCGPLGSCLLCHGPSASVGDACYHIEEAEVDCDKTIHGHPCCVISEDCECVQERFHTQIFPPALPPRECIGYKPAKVGWRPPTIVAILLLVIIASVLIMNFWRRRRRRAKDTVSGVDDGEEEEEEVESRDGEELDV